MYSYIHTYINTHTQWFSVIINWITLEPTVFPNDKTISTEHVMVFDCVYIPLEIV